MTDLDILLSKDAEMTPEGALRLGKIIGRSFKNILVGTDSNPCNGMIKDSVISGLLSVGASVRDLGIIPMPLMTLPARGDCILSISEPDEQGIMGRITILNPDGSPLTQEQIKQMVRTAEGDRNLPKYKDVGALHHYSTVTEDYIDMMVEEHHTCNGAPVILDCGCGCTSLCVPQILASLGADLITIDAQPNAKYCSRSPSVEKGNLSVLLDMVRNNAGNIGIALNGNGTHLALIDEGGDYVEPDRVLSLILLYLKPTSLVIPVSMSSVADDAINNLIGEGINTPHQAHSEHTVIRAGDDIDSIIAAMKEHDADIGALSDGGIIYSDMSLCPNAINTAIILSKMAGDNNIRDLLSSFPKYIVLTDSIKHSGNRDLFEKKLDEKIGDLENTDIWRTNVLRVGMNHGWFTVSRDSEDPELIRITAESKDRAYVVSLMELAKDIVRKCL